MRKLVLFLALGIALGLGSVMAQASDPIVGDWRLVGTSETVQIRAVPGYTGKFTFGDPPDNTFLFRAGNAWAVNVEEEFWVPASVTLSGNNLLITFSYFDEDEFVTIPIAFPLVRR